MPPTQKHLFVFDSPRTCSHLMFKLFEEHPTLYQIRHPWLPIAFAPDRIQLKLKCNPAAQEVHQSFDKLRLDSVPANWTREDGLRIMLEGIQQAEDSNRIAMVKEHVPLILNHDFVLEVLRNADRPYVHPGSAPRDNPTFVPDELLRTMRPVFLIRNPLLFVPSNWKIHVPFREDPWDEAFTMFASHRWVRIFYDYARERGYDPIIVDAEDVVHSTDAFARAFCERLGVDAAWQEVWSSDMTDEQRNGQDPWNQALRSIRASGGVIRGGPPDNELSLEDQKEKWMGEYGELIANGLAKVVEDDMPDYLYLRQRKMSLIP